MTNFIPEHNHAGVDIICGGVPVVKSFSLYRTKQTVHSKKSHLNLAKAC